MPQAPEQQNGIRLDIAVIQKQILEYEECNSVWPNTGQGNNADSNGDHFKVVRLYVPFDCISTVFS